MKKKRKRKQHQPQSKAVCSCNDRYIMSCSLKKLVALIQVLERIRLILLETFDLVNLSKFLQGIKTWTLLLSNYTIWYSVPPNPRLMMYGSSWESPVGVSIYWPNIGEGILSGSYRSKAHKWAGWWWISKDFFYICMCHTTITKQQAQGNAWLVGYGHGWRCIHWAQLGKFMLKTL